jgi:HlyD family secretion protein
VVDKIYVHLGQNVHAGQVLFRMKDQYAYSRVASAQAALDSAVVSRTNVQSNGSQEDQIGFTADLARARGEQSSATNALATLEQLRKNGSVSDAEVNAGVQRLNLANATLEALQKRMTARYSRSDLQSWDERVNADKAALNAERVSYANAHLASPISGTVYLLPVNLYDFVPMGADLMHVADLSKLWVVADFSENDVAKLYNQAPAKVTWDGAPGRTWNGKVVNKPLAVVRSGDLSVGHCTIALDDKGGSLPVNSTVTVVVTVERHDHVLIVPREALQTSGTNHFVYRIVEGRLLKTPVETGIINATQVEIKSGLGLQDEIAVHGMNGEELVSGRKVFALHSR